MRVLLWHVHGGWTDAFVRGDHEYLLPTTPARDGWGLGRGGRDWPNAVEIAPEALRDAEIDAVVLQRPDEIAEVERLLGRRPGRDLPAVFLEHNTPKGDVPNARHPLADSTDIPIVHVTHVNALLWDTGRARTRVIEHGIVDPGHRYTGGLARIGTAINEPVRRWRVTGTDLLPRFAEVAPVDVYGMGTDLLSGAFGDSRPAVTGLGDVKPGPMHAALAERRLYLHPMRWTSLGLARIGTAINEPVRRWRVTGTDLLPRFAEVAPVDVYGMGTDLLSGAFGDSRPAVTGLGDVKPGPMHAALAERRLYLHPMRWTSLGLALLEAMHLGLPVVALAMTEAPRAVPPEAGAISADVDELVRAARRLIADPDEAASRGRIAREAALERYGLQRFLDDWDEMLAAAVARRASGGATPSGGIADSRMDVG